MHILFATPHGSHLYGTSTPTSDHDFYRVVTKLPNIYEIRPKKFAKQDIRGLDDVLTVDFSTWTRLCEKGVPQALEAMFSTMATVDKITAYRKSYRVGTAVLPTYMRTIKGFAFKGEYDDKFRRHAIRLAINAADIRAFGRFNPTLSMIQKNWLECVFRFHTSMSGWCDPTLLYDDLERHVFGNKGVGTR